MINWKHLALLACALAAAAVLSAPAKAATRSPKLTLMPVQVMGYVGESLQVRIEIGCGAELYGLIATEAPGARLQLAAAVDQGSIVCTSVPQPRDFMIDFLATRGFKTIEPMPVAETPARLMLAPVTRLKQLKTRNHRIRLDALYEPRCGQVIGTLLRPAPSVGTSGLRDLQVAVVERQAFGAVNVGTCAVPPKTRRVSVLDPAAKYRVVGLRMPAKTNLNRAYEVRLARTVEGSLRVGEHGGVEIKYERACNEAPIGLVLGKDQGPGTPLAVGIVVAHYLNVKCMQKTTTGGWRDPDLTLPSGRVVTLLDRRFGNEGETDLFVVTPTGIEASRSKGKRVFSMSYASRCATTLGAVYTRDSQGKLAAGALVSGGAYECKKPGAEVSLTQAYVARRVRLADLIPLRLRGQPAH